MGQVINFQDHIGSIAETIEWLDSTGQLKKEDFDVSTNIETIYKIKKGSPLFKEIMHFTDDIITHAFDIDMKKLIELVKDDDIGDFTAFVIRAVCERVAKAYQKSLREKF